VSEELQQRVSEVVKEILPRLEMDGAGIEVVSIDRGVVQVRLSGTCTSCPATVRAVLMGLEEELRKAMPEIDYLEAVP
jgi:Fe-S cluster biogenesis protein NfuA